MVTSAERTEPASGCRSIDRSRMLIAEKEHLILHQGCVQLVDPGIIDPGQIDTDDTGSKARRDPIHHHHGARRHSSASDCSDATSSTRSTPIASMPPRSGTAVGVTVTVEPTT